jgi:hypothetical protein
MMKMKLLILSLLSLIAFAEPSQRRCMILPVKDSVGGAIGFKVYNKVEVYLKASKWCYYKSNSEIINILGSYKRTLDAALENPEVLKVLSTKTKAGSLIKIKLESLPKGMRVHTTVLGANGKDVFFNEQTDITTDDIDVIAQTVINWLDIYEKNIPYDGRVVGVLGEQFTVDIGDHAGIYNDFEIKVVRPVSKKRHPLLKEVVDWRTMPVATAKIFHVGKSQTQAKVVSYDRETLVQPDDWVLVVKNKTEKEISKLKYERASEESAFSFGKLGVVGVSLALGSGSTSITSSGVKKLSGFLPGVEISAELWATRNYWVGMDIGKQFSSYSKDEGNLVNESNSMTLSKFKLKAGYKYLPLGFFYGPQIDGYLGYASYSYGFETQTNDGLTAMKFSGILLGTRGSIPIMRNARMFLILDFIFSPTYSEDIAIYGEPESKSSFDLEFGGNYKYSPNMLIEGSLGYMSSKASFANPTVSITNRATIIKMGTKFNF